MKLATVVLVGFATMANAQTESGTTQIAAEVRDRQLGEIAGEPERVAQVAANWLATCKASPNGDSCYQAAYASYLAASLQLQDKDRAAGHIVACAQSLASVSTDATMKAEADALLAGCYGLSIAINPAKGRSLGPESARLLDNAMRLAPENPRVLFLAANRLFNTPEMWGGDKKEARDLLQRALPLIKAEQAAPNRPAWGLSQIERMLRQMEVE